jgi:hypothetical protein
MKNALVIVCLALSGCAVGITVSNSAGSLDDCVGVSCRK